MKGKVEKELEHLQRLGIIEPVQFSKWAASIVPVLKDDKSARICGDYKLTVTWLFHPVSNGLAERAVQTVKEGLKRMTGDSLSTRVSGFLFQYRLTPQTTTGQSPEEMLMNRRPNSRLDLLRPDIKAQYFVHPPFPIITVLICRLEAELQLAEVEASFQALKSMSHSVAEYFCQDPTFVLNL
ncbi:hypothetical protein SKAU_G00282400 [Synaphobranchus kaupii]|uniref:Uncharacterized protein n=1 Tax=Synaphobranchus kaupii TaxID=118154 RepID=A0A9Q1IN55_SYNKA|nr:hypothetical protein SKAU_G00282400 [Synaphobranchus kaupii]